MPLELSENCCLCNRGFDEANLPRMMPSCDHSVCTNCLKNVFKNGTKVVICRNCGNQQQILEPDLEYFPKNINLIKLMKQTSSKKPSSTAQFTTPTKYSQNGTLVQSNASISSNQQKQSFNSIVNSSASDFMASDSSLISQNSFASQQTTQSKICPTHNKELEIICLRDFTKLCPLCAVFGTHKDHELKTVDETSQILNSTLKQFQQLKIKKKTLEGSIKNAEFKGQLIEKIATNKNRLAKEIKDRFAAVKQAVATAQKNANDDLNKRFKQVNDKINRMVKEESEFESFFTNWSKTMELQLAQTNRIAITFQEKTKIYFTGPMKALQEGQFYMGQIQAYVNQKKHRMECVSDLVSLEVGQNLIKDIYNYLLVRFQDNNSIPYNQNLLTSSRANTNTTLQTKNNILHKNNYMTKNAYSNIVKQPSLKQIGSNINLQQEQNEANTMAKRPIKVQFSSSQNFLSPNTKERIQSPSSGISSGLPPRKSPRQKSKSLPKPQTATSNNLIKSRLSPQKKQLSSNKSIQISQERKRYLSSSTQGIVQLFLSDDKLDTLDLCSFDMPDHQVVLLLDYVNNKKKVKCLKLSQNKLTNDGFTQMLPYLKFTTNLNLSSNFLTEDVLNVLIKNRQKVPSLRILNLAHNKVNERKAKVYVDELKKQGIIATLT